jgi:hypothetical protein
MKYWKGNEHHMVQDDEPEPTHDPPGHCESCGWKPDPTDPPDFIWAATAAWIPKDEEGQWLCLECD